MTLTIGNHLAAALLFPGTLFCSKLNITTDYNDLVRMLVNSLVWTTLGIIAVAMAA